MHHSGLLTIVNRVRDASKREIMGIPFNILHCSTPRQGMLDYAVHSEAVVITRDDFSDLQGMKPEWDKVIRNSLLALLFTNDGVDEFIQWPNNPLGPWGPTLDTT